MNEGGALDERFALAPDPELARVAWERVRDAGVELQSEDVIRLLGFSTAAGDFLVRHPDEGTAVGDPSGRDRAALENEVAADIDRLGVVAGLRRFRRRAILRVAARDLAGAAVDDVVREISDVADACVQAACPPNLAVVALGKWGGRELNYASDIDLLLVHGQDDPGAAEMVRTLSEQTEDGIAFKVDAALRPGGRSAALSRSLEATLAYYERESATWERQAMIKARAAAGDLALGEAFVEGVEPFVYPGSSGARGDRRGAQDEGSARGIHPTARQGADRGQARARRHPRRRVRGAAAPDRARTA